MIALYLLAAHMLGDYVLQTRWQAATKIVNGWVRFRHVTAYSVPFVPLAIWLSRDADQAAQFMVLLWLLHFITDSHRFRSTLGDWIGWRLRSPEQRRAEWLDQPGYESFGRTSDSMPPNPWTPISILIDQSLHFAQLAVLGAAYFS